MSHDLGCGCWRCMLPQSRAARVDMVMELLAGIPEYDEDGNIVGRGPPLITKEDAMALLGMVKSTKE